MKSRTLIALQVVSERLVLSYCHCIIRSLCSQLMESNRPLQGCRMHSHHLFCPYKLYVRLILCLQMSELAFDFAEGLVVNIGIQGEEKELLLKKWTEFSSNSQTFLVRACSGSWHHVSLIS